MGGKGEGQLTSPCQPIKGEGKSGSTQLAFRDTERVARWALTEPTGCDAGHSPLVGDRRPIISAGAHAASVEEFSRASRTSERGQQWFMYMRWG